MKKGAAKKESESEKQARADAHLARGAALYSQKRFAEAMLECRTGLELAGAMPSVDLMRNSAHGTYSLAIVLHEGVPEAGIAPNRAEALRLMRKAAEGGIVDAMFNVAVWLGEDNKDDPEQLVWYGRAIEKGDKRSMNQLGVCYKTGMGGLEIDISAAITWYRKAAALSDEVAMYNLGALHELGHGVEKNLATAAEWYARASNAGDKDAPAALQRVKIFIAFKETVENLKVSSSSSSSSSTSSTVIARSLCAACGEPADNHCSGCLEKFYCSHECQLAQWKEHKVECKAKQAKLKEQEK